MSVHLPVINLVHSQDVVETQLLFIYLLNNEYMSELLKITGALK